MIRTVSVRVANLLSRNNATREFCRAALAPCCGSQNATLPTSQTSRSMSSVVCGSSRPVAKWEMPPSLVERLLPVLEPPAPHGAPLTVGDLPWSEAPKAGPGSHAPPKQAARLIVIRRRKMKKHKRRKLLKRMRFEWQKLRLRRETKKEKDFQQDLIDQVDKARGFDAEQYVLEKLKRLKMSGKI